MDNITITRMDGSLVPMASKSTATAIKSAKQTWELLGNDVVNINVESPFPQVYGIGDKITVFGRQYKLNRLPKVKKTGMHRFSYDLEFEGVQYDLIRATYDLTIDTTNNQLQDVQADSLTGNLANANYSGFADVLISNANRVFPGVWALGDYPETEYKTLTLGENDNCLSVLQRLCSEFSVEFEIVQSGGVYTINFVEKVGQIFPNTFQFGKGKGLYALDRQNVDSSNIVTRLKVFGSTSNITHKYRANRLCLPGCTKGQSYIENAEAVSKYGIFEAVKYFEDIKPAFNGTVTGIVPGNVLQFIDAGMFDLNESDENGTKYLLTGVSAKIHFNTGNLAGYEFDVHAYDHATKTFTLVKITDERGDEFPNSASPAFQFNIGDEYKILDIALPEQYETTAEEKLLEAGNTYYGQNSQPKVQYGLSVTKEYLKKFVGNGTTVNIFSPGDYIPIKDTDIDVDKSVRIKSLTRNLQDEYEYNLTISDTVTTNITNRIISELIDLDKVITINNLKDPARARNNWRNSQELLNMVFDPEGDYYTDKIKPESIDTIALSVGAKSMQFGLTNTIFQPNYNGDKNVVKVTGGVLTHYTVDEDSARSWVLANNTTTFNTDSQAYYIYAKCSRKGQDGSIIFSTEQIKVEQDVGFYHFWIGVANSVDVEMQARSIALSYGFTMVNGRFIKTGRIRSADGETYFDLDSGEIGGNIHFLHNGENIPVQEGIDGAIDRIGIGGVNLLRNTGFTGDYQARRLEADTPLSSGSEMFSERLKYWEGDAQVNEDSASASGYSCRVASRLSQAFSKPLITGERYVLSFKAKGNVTVKTGTFTANKSVTGNDFERLTCKFEANRASGIAFSGDCTLCEIQLERGTIATAWSPSPEDNPESTARFEAIRYLSDAVRGRTSILGGLILTTMIQLGIFKDGELEKITSGISGIYNDDDDVAFWAGGTLEDAIRTAMRPDEKTGAGAVITHGGKAIFNEAVIRGLIYAEGGKFKGRVEAEEGYFRGKVESNKEGMSVILDPEDYAKVKLVNTENGKVAANMGFIDPLEGTTQGYLTVYYYDSAGNLLSGTRVNPGKIDITNGQGMVSIAVLPNGKSYVNIPNLPTAPGDAGMLYRDGNTLKITT